MDSSDHTSTRSGSPTRRRWLTDGGSLGPGLPLVAPEPPDPVGHLGDVGHHPFFEEGEAEPHRHRDRAGVLGQDDAEELIRTDSPESILDGTGRGFVGIAVSPLFWIHGPPDFDPGPVGPLR